MELAQLPQFAPENILICYGISAGTSPWQARHAKGDVVKTNLRTGRLPGVVVFRDVLTTMSPNQGW
jgi:hypothetical protein